MMPPDHDDGLTGRTIRTAYHVAGEFFILFTDGSSLIVQGVLDPGSRILVRRPPEALDPPHLAHPQC